MIEAAAARTAAAFGWRVFPTRDKRPLVSSWRRDASTDTDAFDWAEADGYGIALPENVVVLDLDADGGDVSAAVQEVKAAFGPKVGATLRSRTRNGGCHLFFRADTEGMRQTKPSKHVDMRVGGLGYVIGPGSVGYEWLVPPDPAALRPFPPARK